MQNLSQLKPRWMCCVHVRQFLEMRLQVIQNIEHIWRSTAKSAATAVA